MHSVISYLMRAGFFFLLLCGLTACHSSSVETNPLVGAVYREKDEIDQFQTYAEKHSGVIQSIKDENGDFEFAITLFQKEKKYIVVFERLIRVPNDPKTKYRILDVLDVEMKSENELITFGSCEDEKGFNEQIIALIQPEGNEGATKVLKAWRVNTESEKIDLLTSIANIKCTNAFEITEEEAD